MAAGRHGVLLPRRRRPARTDRVRRSPGAARACRPRWPFDLAAAAATATTPAATAATSTTATPATATTAPAATAATSTAATTAATTTATATAFPAEAVRTATASAAITSAECAATATRIAGLPFPTPRRRRCLSANGCHRDTDECADHGRDDDEVHERTVAAQPGVRPVSRLCRSRRDLSGREPPSRTVRGPLGATVP